MSLATVAADGQPSLRTVLLKLFDRQGFIFFTNYSSRKARDIERFAGMERFMREIDRRGYHVAENAGQFIIFCNRAPIRWLASPPETLS